MFLFGFLIDGIRKYFIYFYLPQEILDNQYNFFPKCLVEFMSDLIWAWCFLFQKVINYWSSFLHKYGPVQIVYFLFCECW